MSPRSAELDAYPSMTAARPGRRTLARTTAPWLNPAFIGGPLAELGNWLARPPARAVSASTRRAYRIPRQSALSRGLQSRPYDYARFGSGLELISRESIQAGLGVK